MPHYTNVGRSYRLEGLRAGIVNGKLEISQTTDFTSPELSWTLSGTAGTVSGTELTLTFANGTATATGAITMPAYARVLDSSLQPVMVDITVGNGSTYDINLQIDSVSNSQNVTLVGPIIKHGL